MIGRMLHVLLDGAQRGELQVVVVANGCSDATAEVARQVSPSVTVVETPVGAKHHALNIGDLHSEGFPRLYVDADVELSAEAVRRVARALGPGQAAMAAPRLRLVLDGASTPVKAFHRVWLSRPFARSGLAGTGVYGLSEEGRRRFDEFPPITGDDAFVRAHFAPGERRSVPDAEVLVHAPRTLRGVLNRRVRVYTGNAELRRYLGRPLSEVETPSVAWVHTVRNDPRQVPAVVLYIAICGLAKVLAWRRIRWGDVATWDRDDSSRVSELP